MSFYKDPTFSHGQFNLRILFKKQEKLTVILYYMHHVVVRRQLHINIYAAA